MATSRVSCFLRQLTRGMAAEALADLADRELVQRLLDGPDEAAFEALVRRHGPMVYRVCWRILQHAEDCEDAFQATFLLLARKLPTVKKPDSLASWLHGVARHVALDAQKQATRRRRHEESNPVSPGGPPDEIIWRELRALLDAELVCLPEKHSLPLILCYLEGRTQEEAARQLGWNKRTLQRRLVEARAALGRRLTRKGIVWPAALSGVLISDCVAPAALSSKFIGSTVEAGASILFGSKTAGIVPASVAALVERVNRLPLTQGVVHVMNINKRSIGVGLILMVGLAGIAGILAYRARATPPQTGASEFAQTAESNEPAETAAFVTAREVATIPTTKRAKFVSVQGGGEMVTAVTAAREVIRWNSKTKQAEAVRQLPGKTVIGLSADGTTAVTAAGLAITVADTATGRVLATLETAGPPPGAAERFAAGKRAGNIPQDVKWDPDAWNPNFAILAPDNRTLAMNCGSYLEVWSLEHGKAKRVASIVPFDRPDAPICAFAFSPDGKRVACVGYGGDGLAVWNLTARKRMFYHPMKQYQGNTYTSIVTMKDVTFSPDGRTVVAAGTCAYSWGDLLRQEEKTARTCWLRAWNVTTGVERYTREYVAKKEAQAKFKTIAISGDGSVLAAGIADGRVKLFAPRTGYEVGAFQVDARGDYTISLSKDARTLIVLGNKIRLFALKKGLPLAGPPPEPTDAWRPPWKAVAPKDRLAAAEKLSPAAREYEALLKERNAYFQRVQKEAAALKSKEAVRQLMHKHGLQLQAFARRFLALAKKYPDTPEAVAALWLVYSMMSHGPEAEQAVAELASRYMSDSTMAARFNRVVTGPQARAGRELLRAFARRGATEQIRGQAAFKLAKSLAAAAELVEQLRADKSGVLSRQLEENGPLGDELVKAFRAEDPNQLREEAKRLFQEVAAKYARIPHPYMKGTLGQAVERELEELRNPTLAVGKTAPEIEGKDVEGKTFRLSEYRGKVVLLTFSGNWCGPCRAMYPHERTLVERLKGKRFVALSVNTDREKKTLEESIRKGEITWRCWWDRRDGDIGPISNSWHIEGFPAIFVLDAKGVIRFKGLRGEALGRAIDALLKEREDQNKAH